MWLTVLAHHGRGEGVVEPNSSHHRVQEAESVGRLHFLYLFLLGPQPRGRFCSQSALNWLSNSVLTKSTLQLSLVIAKQEQAGFMWSWEVNAENQD